MITVTQRHEMTLMEFYCATGQIQEGPDIHAIDMGYYDVYPTMS